MSYEPSTLIGNDLIESTLSRYNGGSVKFYTAPRSETSDDDIAAQTLLGTVFLNDQAFGVDENGLATAGGLPLTGVAVADGTIAWFRICASDGSPLGDGDVGPNGDIVLENTSVLIDQTIRITNLTLQVST